MIVSNLAPSIELSTGPELQRSWRSVRQFTFLGLNCAIEIVTVRTSHRVGHLACAVVKHDR